MKSSSVATGGRDGPVESCGGESLPLYPRRRGMWARVRVWGPPLGGPGGGPGSVDRPLTTGYLRTGRKGEGSTGKVPPLFSPSGEGGGNESL